MIYQYWNREMETLDRSALEAYQLTRLKAAVAQALQTPFYRERLPAVGIRSDADIRGLEDIRRIPFTTKGICVPAFPMGFSAFPGRRWSDSMLPAARPEHPPPFTLVKGIFTAGQPLWPVPSTGPGVTKPMCSRT